MNATTPPAGPGLPFVTADQRMAQASAVKAALVGKAGAGKTYAARSLPPKTTLFLDGEAGTKALGDWPGTTLPLRDAAEKLRMHPWELCRGVASLLSGPDYSDYDLQPGGRVPGPYSPEAFEHYKRTLGDPKDMFAMVRTIFVDSITVASRWSFAWSNAQPDSISDKGKKDTRGTYGLHGREMVRWLTVLQHAPYNVIVAGILDRKTDDFNRPYFALQVEGGKAAAELPGIFDNIITLTRFNITGDPPVLDLAYEDGAERGMVCTQNPWGLPAKDRSGRLDMVEKADLHAVLVKINGGRPIG